MHPKEIEYKLHYDDVRGDILRPPHGTTPATVEYNKGKKGLPLETKNTQNHKNWRLGLIDITRTSLLKYTENFTTKIMKVLRWKILKILIFLLKT